MTMTHPPDEMLSSASSSSLLAPAVTAVALIALQVILAQLPSWTREAKRRWQHALTGQCLVSVAPWVPSPTLGVVALGAAAVTMTLFKWTMPTIFLSYFGSLLRPHEQARWALPGAVWFLLGAATTFQCFDLPVACYSLACVSWADPMAAWVGQSIATPRVFSWSSSSSATWAGTMACWGTALAVGTMLLPPSTPLPVRFCSALACAVVEALPVGNDNLVVPLATGTAYVWSSQVFS